MSNPRLCVPPKSRGGETVGDYVLGKTLGKGTTGKVKLAFHKKTNAEVAIKIIKKQYVRTHKNKIAREIAVMRLLDHPFVMKQYDVFETGQHMFLVLERVKGGELFDYILQKGRLPRNEALRIMAQIIQGVDFCHMHSICHRDLKPENLLLDENMNIKIADFGMAQISPGGKVLDTFCGSPHYGAPEVVSGILYDGRKSDVWSLGVVFYALVTGMLPFDNPNISQLLRMVKRGVYHMPKFVPEDIADLIDKMLTVDVDKRIKTPEIKYHKCWLGEHGNNLYFPSKPYDSAALENMKKHPIVTEDDIDLEILKDLEGLGWGDSNQLKNSLLNKRDASIHNLESVFYHMIAARNEKRKEEHRSYDIDDCPASPNPYSPTRERAPSGRVTVSTTRSDAENKIEEKEKASSPRRRGPKNLSIKVTDKDDATSPQYSTTPRFHRLKLISSQEEVASPNTPITPTAKRSWLKSLFKRRPSVDIVGKGHQTHGASGMYSEKVPNVLMGEVKVILDNLGVNMKIGSKSDYEMKCEAWCHLDQNFQIVVTDKGGDVKYKSATEAKDNPRPDLLTPDATPAEPKSPTKDLGKTQLIKFTVDVAREESDKVTTVNFNHRNGNLLVYRALYTEIIKHVVL